MIPRYLVPTVAVAHKYGSSGRIKGDAGVVFLPQGPMVIAAFALAAKDGADGAEVIARISRLAVGAIAPDCVAKI